jgi:RNA polymerase sigma factor (sigma-70 family)
VRVRRMASIPAADPGAPAEAVPVQRHSDALPLAATATFDGFYRRELPGLVALAAALAGPASADDIAQEAMLTAYRRWEAVSRLDLPAAWVRRVCANQALSTLRRRGAEARAVLRLGARPQRVVELAPEPDAFWAEVRRLPRRQAQAVALAYVYDMGVAEIATTLDIAEGTVKTHLFRGRAALAVRLGEPTDDAAADAGADQEVGGRP